MSRHRSRWLWIAIASIVLLQGPVFGARWSHEYPDVYPGTWYRIVLDSDGQIITSDGHGEGWYYYPASDSYRMWYPNGNYDPDRRGRLEYHVYIEATDPNRAVDARVRYIWTTPEWSLDGHTSPPTPADVPTLEDEADAMTGGTLATVDNQRLGMEGRGSSEAQRTKFIEEYNPAWVGIEVQARNAYIFRYARHWCEGDDPLPGEAGACCHRATGHCFSTVEGDCQAPYEWLGVGTSCDECSRPADPVWDFGDAPDPSYPTLLASNGARHRIVPGLFLGRFVDGEADGQPDLMASGDNAGSRDEDGVMLTSTIAPGMDATVQVVASVDGYLNAWVDFDADGSFGGPGEQIFFDQALRAGTNELAFAVPADAAPGGTFARFRFNSLGVLDYDGPADDGEVEDYRIEVARSFEPHPTSGQTALLWDQPLTASSEAEPYSFETGSENSALHLFRVAADDWQAQHDRPITGVHWWGVFEDWTEPYLPEELPLAFHIGVWTDAPDPEPYNFDTFAHPDTLVWETYCTKWTWALAGYEKPQNGFLGNSCFQFTHLLSQDQWFEAAEAVDGKTGTEPTTFWLSITAVYDTSTVKPSYTWSWKTRSHPGDMAATSLQELISPDFDSTWPPAIGAQWQDGKPLRDRLFLPVDMAFQLTTYAPLEPETTPPAEPKAGDGTGSPDLAGLAAGWLAAKN